MNSGRWDNINNNIVATIFNAIGKQDVHALENVKSDLQFEISMLEAYIGICDDHIAKFNTDKKGNHDCAREI